MLGESTVGESAVGNSTPRDSAVAPGSWTRSSKVRWWPLVVPLVVVLVGAWLYRWVDEDAFINFRIIHNLLAGYGPVFNVGERVEVDSDPLWLFTLAGLHVILPFVDIEWLSVVVGLICTGAGVLAGGRAVGCLAASRNEGTVLPLGLLLVSVVAGVWEFATSGLEMSMVFLWLGLSFLLLVRLEQHRSRAVLAAFVIGLGPLIRPELTLASAVLLVAMVVVVAAPEPTGRGRLRSVVAPLAAAAALPVAYQIFRMGYYALAEPNTGLAKAGIASWWSQGFTYLWNFVAPYTLWLPFALAAPLVCGRFASWWHRGDRIGVVVLSAPIVAGMADVIYVVYIGGDYMHARLLLPGFFALCLPVYASLRQLRTLMVVPVAAIAVWAVVCAGWLRFVPPPEHGLNPQTVFISNERNSWIGATGDPHPITAADYSRALSGKAGEVLHRMADRIPPRRQEMLVVTSPFRPIGSNPVLAARSPLPFSLAVNLPAIGVIGYLAGPHVYVFDTFSLANPIGSHTVIVRHARPGHEKEIGPAWMLARFGIAGRVRTGPSSSVAQVAAARRALGCEPLRGYLRAITEPLTVGGFLANIGNSFSYTTMRFSADPARAAAELCAGRGPTAHRPP
ncbi:MAG: hypothetical protein ACYDDZ_02875 [Acidimicrobiales bacterium]